MKCPVLLGNGINRHWDLGFEYPSTTHIQVDWDSPEKAAGGVLHAVSTRAGCVGCVKVCLRSHKRANEFVDEVKRHVEESLHVICRIGDKWMEVWGDDGRSDKPVPLGVDYLL